MNKKEFDIIRAEFAEFMATQHKGKRYLFIVEGENPYETKVAGQLSNPFLAESIQVLQRIWVDNNRLVESNDK